MLEGAHEDWGARVPEQTGGVAYKFRELFRLIDELAAHPWTEADSQRMLEQIMAKIERRRRRRRARRMVALGAALAVAVWLSFRVVGSGAFAGSRF